MSFRKQSAFGAAAAVFFMAVLAGLASVQAQPAGTFILQWYYEDLSCTLNKTTNFLVERPGTCTNSERSSSSIYRTCNATHITEWQCPQLNCVQDCVPIRDYVQNQCNAETWECRTFSTAGWFAEEMSRRVVSPTKWDMTIGFNDTSTSPSCNPNSEGFKFAYYYEGPLNCMFDQSASRYAIHTCNNSYPFRLWCDDPLCTVNCELDFYTSVRPDYEFCPATGSESFTVSRCVDAVPLNPPVAPPVQPPVVAPVAAPVAAPTAGATPMTMSTPVVSGSSPVATPVASPVAAAPKLSTPTVRSDASGMSFSAALFVLAAANLALWVL